MRVAELLQLYKAVAPHQGQMAELAGMDFYLRLMECCMGQVLAAEQPPTQMRVSVVLARVQVALL